MSESTPQSNSETKMDGDEWLLDRNSLSDLTFAPATDPMFMDWLAEQIISNALPKTVEELKAKQKLDAENDIDLSTELNQ